MQLFRMKRTPLSCLTLVFLLPLAVCAEAAKTGPRKEAGGPAVKNTTTESKSPILRGPLIDPDGFR